ncbi:aminotransferase class I/II-fold pyridoxal phosphate-dependent enzyme [bacterium]|nr:aminotransferase class I/II-fold pyridoxal phosphate-dependent enzyme [bacterium]
MVGPMINLAPNASDRYLVAFQRYQDCNWSRRAPLAGLADGYIGHRPGLESIIDLAGSDSGLPLPAPMQRAQSEAVNNLLASYGRMHDGKNPPEIHTVHHFLVNCSQEQKMAVAAANKELTEPFPAFMRKAAFQALMQPLKVPGSLDQTVPYLGSSIDLFKHALQTLGNEERNIVLFPPGMFDKFAVSAHNLGFDVRQPDNPPPNSAKMTPATLASMLADSKDRCAAFVLFNPAYPTGEHYNEAELKALAWECIKAGVPVICDEVFAQMELSAPHHSMASITIDLPNQQGCISMHNHTITLCSSSKYLGLLLPRKISAASTGNPAWQASLEQRIRESDEPFNGCAPNGWAMIVSHQLNNAPPEHRVHMRQHLEQRWSLVAEQARYGTQWWDDPEASPFAILCFDPDLLSNYGIENNLELMEYLHLVAGVHTGLLTANGFEGMGVRINYACREPDVTTAALDRIDRLVRSMEQGMAPFYSEVLQMAHMTRSEGMRAL